MIAWGQLYEADKGNLASNTRIQIRDIKAYVLSKRDRKWHLLQSSRTVERNAYREDFAGDINKPADVIISRMAVFRSKSVRDTIITFGVLAAFLLTVIVSVAYLQQFRQGW